MNTFTRSLRPIAFIAALAAVLAVPPQADAAACAFNRDLSMGDTGEDIRCLQQFLNSNGYIIADSGVGSPGHETNQFAGGTKAALVKWQIANGILPATGTFGPQSRAKYVSMSAPSQTTTISSSNSGSTMSQAEIDRIIANAPAGMTIIPIGSAQSTPSVSGSVSTSGSSSTSSSSASSARSDLKKLKTLIEDTTDDIDNAEDDGENVSDARTLIQKAHDKYVDALYRFVIEDYAEASDISDRAKEYAEDAADEIEGTDSRDKSDANKAIDDAYDAIDNARDDIADADDDGRDVGDAEDLLDDAKRKLQRAEDAYDDKDYESAIDLANDAEDLANDAVDAID